MNITFYTFAFILVSSEYRIHGLWPDNSSCCNIDRYLPYHQPSDSIFIEKYWLDGLDHTKISGCNISSTTLFEHEALKHGSCMDLSPTQYLQTVKNIFLKIQPKLNKLCVNQQT